MFVPRRVAHQALWPLPSPSATVSMAASFILRCPFAVGVGVSLKSSIIGASLVVSVPEVVFNKALAVGARGWLDELPELVIRLEKE